MDAQLGEDVVKPIHLSVRHRKGVIRVSAVSGKSQCRPCIIEVSIVLRDSALVTASSKFRKSRNPACRKIEAGPLSRRKSTGG